MPGKIKLTRLTETMRGSVSASAEGGGCFRGTGGMDLLTQLKDRVLYIKREIEVFRKKSTIGAFSVALKRLIHTMGIPSNIMCSQDEDSVKRDSASPHCDWGNP